MSNSFYTTEQAAKKLGCIPRRVRAMIKEGKFPAMKFGGTYIIEKAILDDFAEGYTPRPGKRSDVS